MPAGLPSRARGSHDRTGTLGPASQEIDMTWQTPQAQDFRFGFEITMYVAAR